MEKIESTQKNLVIYDLNNKDELTGWKILFKYILGFTSKDRDRYQLSFVHFENKNIVATDGFKIVVVNFEDSDSPFEEGNWKPTFSGTHLILENTDLDRMVNFPNWKEVYQPQNRISSTVKMVDTIGNDDKVSMSIFLDPNVVSPIFSLRNYEKGSGTLAIRIEIGDVLKFEIVDFHIGKTNFNISGVSMPMFSQDKFPKQNLVKTKTGYSALYLSHPDQNAFLESQNGYNVD